MRTGTFHVGTGTPIVTDEPRRGREGVGARRARADTLGHVVAPQPARPLVRAVLSLTSIASGASLSAVPPAALAISAHLFTVDQQGYVAFAVTTATFLSQLVFAALIESRLSSALSRGRVALPVWILVATALAVATIAIFPTTPLALCLALPVLLSALEVGRGVAVVEHMDLREFFAALFIGAGAIAGVVGALLGQGWALVALAVGVGCATALRTLAAPRRAPAPDSATRAWVVTDAGVTGVVFPVLNALVLALLGPAASTLFAAVSTVSGLLAIPVNFMRLRLLKERTRHDVVVSTAAFVACVAVLIALDLTGVLGLLFGTAWTTATTILPLLAACLWRVATLLSMFPFAALRRGGHARLVTLMRGSAALLSALLALAATLTQSVWVVFIALLVGELFMAAICELARRRVRAPL